MSDELLLNNEVLDVDGGEKLDNGVEWKSVKSSSS